MSGLLLLVGIIFGIPFLIGLFIGKKIWGSARRGPTQPTPIEKKVTLEKCPFCEVEVRSSVKVCPGCNSVLNFPLLKELDRLQYLLREMNLWADQKLADSSLLSVLKQKYEARKEEILTTVQPWKVKKLPDETLQRHGDLKISESPPPIPSDLIPSQASMASEGMPESIEIDQKPPRETFDTVESAPEPAGAVSGSSTSLSKDLPGDTASDSGFSSLAVTIEESTPEIDRRIEAESGWVRLVQAFLDEKNIKWLGVLGALGVVISSVVLVSRYWDQFPSFLRYFLMIAYTASFYGLGVMATRKLNLEKTGQILFTITTFLLPLNFIYLERLGLLSGLGGILIFAVGTGILTFLSQITFKVILDQVSLLHLIAFMFLSAANTLLPALQLHRPPASIFVALALGLLTLGGIHAATRFYLHEQTFLQKWYPVFAASVILYVYTLALVITLEIPISWYGLILMMISIPLAQTAHVLSGIFRSDPSPEGPLPMIALAPYLAGYGLSLAAYAFALPNAHALFFTALVGSGLYSASAYQYKQKFFVYLAIASLGITYFYSPIFFEGLALRFNAAITAPAKYNHLPYPFYGFTFIPFNLALIEIARWLDQKGEKALARPFYEVSLPLSILLLVLSCFELKALVMVSAIYAALFALATYFSWQKLLLYPSVFCVTLWVLALSLYIPIPVADRGLTFASLGLIWLVFGFFSRNSIPFHASGANNPERPSRLSQDLGATLNEGLRLLPQMNPFPVMAILTSLLAIFFQILSTFQYPDPVSFSPVASPQLIFTALLLSALYGITSFIFRSLFFIYGSALCTVIAFFSLLSVLEAPMTALGLCSALYSLALWGIGYGVFYKFFRGPVTAVSHPKTEPFDSFFHQVILALYRSALALSGITWILSIPWGKESYQPVLALLLTALLYLLAASRFDPFFWWYPTIVTVTLAAYFGIIAQFSTNYQVAGFAALSVVWIGIGYGLVRFDDFLERFRLNQGYRPPLLYTIQALSGYAIFFYLHQIGEIASTWNIWRKASPSVSGSHFLAAVSISLSFFLQTLFFRKEVLLYPAILILSTGIYVEWISRLPVAYHFLMLTILACFWGLVGVGMLKWKEGDLTSLSLPSYSSASPRSPISLSPFHHISLGMLTLLLAVQISWTTDEFFAPTLAPSTSWWGLQLGAIGLLSGAYGVYFRIYSWIPFLYLFLSASSLVLPRIALSFHGALETVAPIRGGALLLTAFIWLGVYQVLSLKSEYLNPFYQFSIGLSLGAFYITFPWINPISAFVIFLTGILYLLWGLRITRNGWIYFSSVLFNLSLYYFLITGMVPAIQTLDEVSFTRLLPIFAPMGFLSLVLAYGWFSLGRKAAGSSIFGFTIRPFYVVSIVLSILTGFFILFSSLNGRISTLYLVLSILTLGLTTILQLGLAHILEWEELVYLGGTTLIGLYGYLKATDLIRDPSWDKITAISAGFLLLWTHTKVEELRLDVFQRPIYVMSYLLSIGALLISLWHIDLISAPVILLVGILHLLWGLQTSQNGWIYSAGIWFTLGFYYLLIAWMIPEVKTLGQLSLDKLLPVTVPMGFLSLLLAYLWFGVGRKRAGSQTFGLAAQSFHQVSFCLSFLAGLFVWLSAFSKEIPTFHLVLGVATLGAAALLQFWLAHILQRESLVYIGELTLVSLYGYLRVTKILQALFWGKVVLIALSFFLMWVNTKIQRLQLTIFQRPTYLTSLIMPAISVILAVRHSFNGSSPYDQITGVNPFIIACAASYYTLLAFQKKNKELGYLGAVLYDGALFSLWIDLKLTDPQFYLVPLGMTVIFVAQLNRDSLGKQNLSYLRSFGSLIIYASPAWSVVTSGSDIHALSLALFSVLGIAIGIAFRIRAFLYLGSLFLVMDLIAQVIIQSYHSSLFKWLCILLAGVLIITLAAFFERKREIILRRMRALGEVLETWE
jgi:hypothetical protein